MGNLLVMLLLVAMTGNAQANTTVDSDYIVLGSQGAPLPTRSAYLLTKQGGFVVKSGEGVAYAMLFQTHALNHPLYTETAFQNPCKADAPFLVKSTIAAKQSEFEVESPAFQCVRNDAAYLVRIRIFRDELRTKLIGEHEQRVLFEMPEDQARMLGLILQ